MLLQRNNADENFINDRFFCLFLRGNEVDLVFARTDDTLNKNFVEHDRSIERVSSWFIILVFCSNVVIKHLPPYVSITSFSYF